MDGAMFRAAPTDRIVDMMMAGKKSRSQSNLYGFQNSGPSATPALTSLEEKNW